MRIGKFLCGAVVAAILCLILSAGNFVAAKDQPADAKSAQIERGRYLVATIGGCNDCHTPKKFTGKGPELDMDHLLSGFPTGEKLPDLPKEWVAPMPGKWGAATTNDLTAWYGPWGVSFAANLTPDLETGIGSWTEQMFFQAMRTGKHLGAPDGRDILPPMPWQGIGDLTDDDLNALFAYFKSLKPVSNAVPEPIPPQK